jgi:hypothetical protein
MPPPRPFGNPVNPLTISHPREDKDREAQHHAGHPDEGEKRTSHYHNDKYDRRRTGDETLRRRHSRCQVPPSIALRLLVIRIKGLLAGLYGKCRGQSMRP